MIVFETEVLDIIDRAPGIKSFRFKTKDEVDFEAGQFFLISIKIDGTDQTKHFSFSNSPTEKGYIEFTKRITDSEFSKALGNLRIGDWAKIKMPHGSFVYEGRYKKIAFLSGGIGITPIRSICKFVTDKGLPTEIALIYSNNTKEGIIFRDDLDSMQKTNGNIRITYTLTSPDIDKEAWQGRTGYINADMIREEIPDYKERVFYICGPPAMVTSLSDELRVGLKLQEENIKTENFTGY